MATTFGHTTGLDARAFKYADMVAKYLRNNSGAQMMVLNIPNVLQQLTGFAPAKLRLGRRKHANGGMGVYRQPQGTG